MKIFVTGGAGFIGSHIAEFYAEKGHDVVVFDNLSRARLLRKSINQINYNWDYLKNFQNVELLKGDIINLHEIERASKGADFIFHTAAQTAVTTSIQDPVTDFQSNCIGTFNVLESARRNDIKTLIYCSTNKVYGENVNKIEVVEDKSRYVFSPKYKHGVPEDFPVDLCEHTPYGCSKLAGDLYAQDYGGLYGIKTGVFRMSCIYGPRQMGVEDQGWLTWFTIASLLGKEITIYGDGKQVRDVLYVKDLVSLFDKFLSSNLKNVVLNAGGGTENTLSLLELIGKLEKFIGKDINKKYSDWRVSDQKVFISDIRKAENLLDWKPKVSPEDGVKCVFDWVSKNTSLFNSL